MLVTCRISLNRFLRHCYATCQVNLSTVVQESWLQSTCFYSADKLIQVELFLLQCTTSAVHPDGFDFGFAIVTGGLCAILYFSVRGHEVLSPSAFFICLYFLLCPAWVLYSSLMHTVLSLKCREKGRCEPWGTNVSFVGRT